MPLLTNKEPRDRLHLTTPQILLLERTYTVPDIHEYRPRVQLHLPQRPQNSSLASTYTMLGAYEHTYTTHARDLFLALTQIALPVKGMTLPITRAQEKKASRANEPSLAVTYFHARTYAVADTHINRV